MNDINDFNFKLTNSEKSSPLWHRLRLHLEFLLETARKKNDGDLSPDQTAKIRGRIECLKSILDFGTSLPPVGDGRGSDGT